MPRTVEGIGQTHEIAQARARQALPSWDGKLMFMTQIKVLADRLDDGDISLTATEMLAGFQAAAKEVREKIPQAKGPRFEMRDEDLERFVQELEGWTVEFVENCPDILEAFDHLMDPLYDWCDVNRWWVATVI
jgi:hypothetical protein